MGVALQLDSGFKVGLFLIKHPPKSLECSIDRMESLPSSTDSCEMALMGNLRNQNRGRRSTYYCGAILAERNYSKIDRTCNVGTKISGTDPNGTSVRNNSPSFDVRAQTKDEL